MSTNPQPGRNARGDTTAIGYTVGMNTLGGDQTARKQVYANTNQRRRIRANETSLTDQEWVDVDENVMEEVQRPLNLIDALEGQGLTADVGMDITEYTWSMRSGDTTEAETTMDPREAAPEDAPAFAKDGVPVPIIHAGYRIGERELQVSRRNGQGLDTSLAEDRARAMAVAMEQMPLTGWGHQLDASTGYQMYGLLNHPDRNTLVGSDWSVGANVKSDMLAAIHTLEDDNYYSDDQPYWLLIADQQYRHLREDYAPSVNVDMTTEEKITDEMAEISNVIRSPYIPAGQAVLFKPVSSVFELPRDPQGVQNVQWENHGGFEHRFKLLTVMSVAVKSTLSGKSGIVHLSGMT